MSHLNTAVFGPLETPHASHVSEHHHHHGHETNSTSPRVRLVRRLGQAVVKFGKDFLNEPDNHSHDDNHDHGTELISSRRLNLLGAANVAIGTLEMATSWTQAQVLALGDGGHNTSVDGIAYTGQAAEQEGKKSGVRAWLGRHYRPFWFAGEAMTFAASISSILNDKETHSPNVWVMASVLGSAALNATVFAKPVKTLVQRTRQGQGLSHREKDIVWHAGLDSSRVVAATVGLGLNAAGFGVVEKAAGLAIGGAGTFIAGRSMVRASREKIAAAWQAAKEKVTSTSPAMRLGVAATSLALTGALASGSVAYHDTSEMITLPPATAEPQAPAKHEANKTRPQVEALKVNVKPGWGIFNVLAQQGVAPEDRQRFLEKIDDELLETGQVYQEDGDLRIKKPGTFTLPPEVVKALQLKIASSTS